MTKTTRLMLAACLAAAAVSASTGARAIPIEYTVTSLAGPGNYFRYEYTVANDGSLPGAAAVALFDIGFDPALYNEASLQIVSASSISAQWDQLILPSGIGVAALYDALSLTGGIAVGGAVSGFAVEFQWLGADPLPGAQTFTIYDPTSFAPLEIGQTVLGQPPSPSVPEPGALALAAAVALALGAARFGRPRMRVIALSA
jgi:hypothetical protein